MNLVVFGVLVLLFVYLQKAFQRQHERGAEKVGERAVNAGWDSFFEALVVVVVVVLLLAVVYATVPR